MTAQSTFSCQVKSGRRIRGRRQDVDTPGQTRTCVLQCLPGGVELLGEEPDCVRAQGFVVDIEGEGFAGARGEADLG